MAFGWTRSSRSSREASLGRRLFPANPKRACSSVRSTTRARRCLPAASSHRRRLRFSRAGFLPALDGPVVIVRLIPPRIRLGRCELSRPLLIDHSGHYNRLSRESLPSWQRRDSQWSFWPRNPIDCFVLRALRDHGLTPAPEASRLTLIRRVTFDLTGLPPSAAEVDAFLADSAPDAYERLVERLIESPAYGQRWASHWLDLVRYAESDGHRQDAFRPQAWHYRDYVVRAFNTDKPYDRFLTEQLAGDEVDPDDPELRIAVGYLRLGTYEYNQRNARGQWSDILNDITDVTGEVFLGLSMGCARCHDHKFDPILQKDYYRLQAFFTPLMPRDDLTMARPREWSAYQAQRAAWEKAAAEVLRQIKLIEQPFRDTAGRLATAKLPEEVKAILEKPEKDRSPLEKQIGALRIGKSPLNTRRFPRNSRGRPKPVGRSCKKSSRSFDAIAPGSSRAGAHRDRRRAGFAGHVIPGERGQKIEPGFPSVLDPRDAQIEASPRRALFNGSQAGPGPAG